jgi:hypothetical protein
MINLSDLTGIPCPDAPDRDAVSSWSAMSMDAYLLDLDRRKAYGSARLAGMWQQQSRPHLDIMLALAGAENAAPSADRPLHAARTDAYASAYGLMGWYRGSDLRGAPAVYVNAIRTTADGDANRWFVHALSPIAQDRSLGLFLVVDRDSGKTAHCAQTRKDAVAWITGHGGGPQ